MPVWDGVQEFIVVSQAGSFTRAARKLGVSTSHVSRQVAALEDRLDAKLLARSTRTVKLTDSGAAYLEKVAPLIEELEDANRLVSGSEAELTGPIRVSAAGPFAENHVVPALFEFADQHPGISLEIIIDNQIVNLIDQGFDYAIRYGDLPDSSLIARKLIERPLACVAAPAYLALHGHPQHPKDLSRHACLRTNADRWMFKDTTSGAQLPVRVDGPLKTNNVTILRHAAERGMGIAYSAFDNFQTALASGSVVTILEGFEDLARPHWIVFPERRHMPLRVRLSIDYLLEKFRPQTA